MEQNALLLRKLFTLLRLSQNLKTKSWKPNLCLKPQEMEKKEKISTREPTVYPQL